MTDPGHDGAPGLPAPSRRRCVQEHEQRGAEAQGPRRLPPRQGKLPEDVRASRRGGVEEEEACLPRVLRQDHENTGWGRWSVTWAGLI